MKSYISLTEKIRVDGEDESLQIALHLYMIKNHIPIKITKYSPGELYDRAWLNKGKKQLPKIEYLLNKVGMSNETVDHFVNGKNGGFKHCLNSINLM